ncbi:MaoC family dehydratase [Leucobacter komagatae]|uniref:Dehydratase n=1 Tax=Leucobacter komagatae TaxID=55969 RepID=A0A0D0IQ44_9MICO|nr:MaoC family dehydratase [Leucobacter komagatae]KIP53714.1 dehydratase [Leucobacter komagatae]
MTIKVSTAAELPQLVGSTATGEWLDIDQERITAFAEATGDEQWIHLDAERAANGPFGATIAHGYLTLSLIPRLASGLVSVENATMVVNYGLDRVRFLQPVRVNSRVRASIEIVSAEASRQGWRVGNRTTIEIEGSEQPALVADTIALYVAP